MLSISFITRGDLMRLSFFVCSTPFSAFSVIGNTRSKLKIPSTATVHRSESCASGWLVAPQTAFFGSGQIAHEEAAADRLWEVARWAGELRSGDEAVGKLSG